MTIEMVATIKTFQGLTTDEKPMGADIPIGSTFHAVDTGDEFIYCADGWILDLRKAAALKRSLML